ncbi:MAG: hypothetical protein AB7O44_31215 [Hyphomicrobiaceae bacterium]
MKNVNVIGLVVPGAFDDQIAEVLRNCEMIPFARRMKDPRYEHCSDLSREDHRINVLGKHLTSDDPCVSAAGFGP